MNRFRFLFFLLILSLNGLSQAFVSPNNLFEKIDYYFTDQGDLSIQFDFHKQKDTTLFLASEIVPIKITATYYPTDENNEQKSITEDLFSNDQNGRIVAILKKLPYNKALNARNRGWYKVDVQLFFKLKQSDGLRKSTIVPIYYSLGDSKSERYSLKINEFNITDFDNQKNAILKFQFEPKTDGIQVTSCKVTNADFACNGSNCIVVEGKNTFNLSNPNNFPVDGNYSIEITYNLNGTERKSLVQYPIKEPRSPYKISAISVEGKSEAIKGNIIHYTGDENIRLKVSTNLPGSNKLIFEGKLSTFAPISDNDNNNDHFFEVNLQQFPDDIYNIRFSGTGFNKEELSGNNTFQILKDTRRIVEKLIYLPDDNYDKEQINKRQISLGVILNKPAPTGRSLVKIRIKGTGENGIFAVPSPVGSLIQYNQVFPLSDIKSYSEKNPNSDIITFEVLYDNSVIFTFDTKILKNKEEVFASITSEIERLRNVSRSRLNNNTEDELKITKTNISKSFNQGNSNPEEVADIANFTVGLVKNSKIDKEQVKEVANSVGKFAVKALKFIVL